MAALRADQAKTGAANIVGTPETQMAPRPGMRK